MPRGRSLTALALIVMALAWSAAARAAGPAGLVVDVSGGKILGVQPFSEIADGSTIAVPSGVRLVFQHYASCRKVTVAGGKVAFTPEGYTITGGTKEAEVRVACPRRLNLKASGEAAGVLLRSIGGGVTLSTRPLFALIGPRADDFKAVRILQGDTVVHESALDGHVFRWPEGEPPLATAVAYTLHLVPAAPGAQAVTTRFVTPRPTSSAPDETVTLITVE